MTSSLPATEVPTPQSFDLASTLTLTPAEIPPLHATPRSVPFRTLARGFRLGGALPQPTLLAAVDRAGRDAVIALVSPQHRALLEATDLQREALLAVFRETMPSGGYAISINAVAVTDSELIVGVTLSEDDPAFPKIEAATLPYHIIAIDRSVLSQRPNWRYRLVSGNTLLAIGELVPR
ncbi:MAG: protease complex subunit PrcB family protein [Anaerolineae bacterium]|nr:protease complex subunit PrcB family protein [Anaerolineae bacterium]